MNEVKMIKGSDIPPPPGKPRIIRPSKNLLWKNYLLFVLVFIIFTATLLIIFSIFGFWLGSNIDEIVLADVIIVFFWSIVLSLLIGITYRGTHQSISYSQNFTQTLVLLGMIVGMIMIIIGTDLAMGLVGAAAIIGHDFSIFLKFTGGKGIATTTGVMFAINSQLILTVIAGWFIFVLLTNYFIVASLLATALIPVVMYMWGFSNIYIIFGVIYLLIALYTHRQDTVRILWGQEKKALTSIRKFFNREKIV